jgi:hypothetical protein
MLLEGVPIDERHIQQLAALLPNELAKKLTVARTFGSQIVALTHRERQEILLALERSSGKLDEDLRLLILRQASWRRR